MTWEKPESTRWPTPLLARSGRLGKLVREYVHDTEEKGGDDAAYARTMARAERRERRRVPILAAAIAATCGAVAMVAVLRARSTPPVAVAPPATADHAAPPARAPSPPAPAPAPAVRRAPPAAPAVPIAASFRLREQLAPLPAGRVDLDGQAIAFLSADGAASGRKIAKGTEIVFGKGELELHVRPRAPGHGFDVRAGRYRFTVIGTVFTISQTRSRLELVVREGKVAVSRGSKRLATVVAGGEWAVALNVAPAPAATAPVVPAPAVPALVLPVPAKPASAATPPALPAPVLPAPMVSAPMVPAPVVPASVVVPAQKGPVPAAVRAPEVPAPPARTAMLVPSTPPSPLATSSAAPTGRPAHPPTPAPAPQSLADCRRLVASQRTSEALLCYQVQAAKGGLGGETAQYEMARTWRDSLGDRARALAAFEDQRARYPKGALRIEADLSIIELLPLLGRHDEAMVETERFLAEHPEAERRGEIHLLRGNIFREIRRDLARAEREYAQGTEAHGRAGDDCRFLHAVCLEGQGRVAEARKAYEAYLRGSKSAHAREVRQRLERLGP